MEPAGPERPGLPTGPHPTADPYTERLPLWPGPVLIVVGLLVAAGAGFLAAASDALDVVVADPLLVLGLLLIGAALMIGGLAYASVRQLRIRRHLPPERYRGPSVLLLLLMVLVTAGVASAPFSADAAALLGQEAELTLLGAAVLLVSTQLALLAVSWLFVFRSRALIGWPSWSGPSAAGALRAGLGWGVVAWAGATAVSVAVTLGLEQIGIEADPQAAERALLLVDPWLAVVAIVVLAPIAEEVFFRGVAFNAWLREAGRTIAYAGSAALFAVIHLSLVAVAPIFLLGLALAWIYRRTGNLLAPIAMHATVNGISVGLALLVRFELVPMPA